MQFVLETQKSFPYLAWGLVISFAILTYTLTVYLSKTMEILEVRTQTNISTLNNDL